MAKVAPYHTVTPEKPYGERDVYHDHDDCPAGRRIEPQNRRVGTACSSALRRLRQPRLVKRSRECDLPARTVRYPVAE